MSMKINFYFCWMSSIHVIISIAISGIGAFLAFVWQSDTQCEEYFIILYIRCIYWILTFVSSNFNFQFGLEFLYSFFCFLRCCCLQLYDHIIKYHHEKLRLSGYHEFYRATLIHKGIPLHTVSLWNTVILGIQTIMQHQYGSDFFAHCTKSFFSPTVYIVIFCAFETIILLAVHGTYIMRVRSFNKAKMPPDAFRGLSPSLSSVNKNWNIFRFVFRLNYNRNL